MGLKRLSLFAVLGAMLSLGVVSDASAGSIADFEPCPRSSSNVLICPQGTEGISYSIKFRGDEQPICAPGDDKDYREEEEALQSHRRAKVADLSEGDDDLLGD